MRNRQRRKRNHLMRETDRKLVLNTADRLDRLTSRITDPEIQHKLEEIVNALDDLHDATAIIIDL